MKLAIVGTGYVGLVTGTCFAESGNNVICVDKLAAKIDDLNNGRIPIYEPGLEELVENNVRDGRLHFTTDLDAAVNHSEIVFIAVGTPQSDDGSADLSGVYAVGEAIAKVAQKPKIIVVKSTVPVGTNAELERRVRAITDIAHRFASNPEFLKEGAAIDDFTKPDRVVVGARDKEVGEALHELYSPFLRTERPYLLMSPESSEMTKYVANCMLATKISFINEMANICESVSADINEVRRGIGHDQRIGFSFLFPGVGYGGSCFPKDVRAMIHMAKEKGIRSEMMESVDHVNEVQKQVLPDKLLSRFGDSIGETTIGVWGLAFKPKTDDIREAPAIVLIEALLNKGAKVKIHDPEALENVRALLGDRPGLQYCEHQYDAVSEADALAIVTEWGEYRTPDFNHMKSLMKRPIVFDGRNIYDPKQMRQRGFEYDGIGIV
jgi:UDPglucose 6-dehydrogenase